MLVRIDQRKRSVDGVLGIFRSRRGAARLADLPDEDLMIRYRRGDPRAFEVLVHRHERGLFSFLVRMLHDAQVAEDLFQETFLRVVRSADSFKRSARFKTWLYTIARNLAVDHMRRSVHRRALSLDAPVGHDDGASFIDLVASAAPGSDRRAQDREFVEALARALADLPAEQREVFLLREYEAMPFKEIAEVVDAPVNTVKSRMRYALEGLRRALVPHRVEP